MPSETVDLVKRLVEAFNRQDLDALAELSDSELEFVSVLTEVDAGGAVFRGPDLWSTYFEHMHETWEGRRAEDVRIFDAGDDRAAAVFQIVGKGKHSGVSVDQTIGITYEIRQGKLWRMRSYRSSVEALEAVGLSE